MEFRVVEIVPKNYLRRNWFYKMAAMLFYTLHARNIVALGKQLALPRIGGWTSFYKKLGVADLE